MASASFCQHFRRDIDAANDVVRTNPIGDFEQCSSGPHCDFQHGLVWLKSGFFQTGHRRRPFERSGNPVVAEAPEIVAPANLLALGTEARKPLVPHQRQFPKNAFDTLFV